jgi:demethylmenaquinone methyltransferase/2-methoxy-6-polyprenyl-1,4-benzoquinol methylase
MMNRNDTAWTDRELADPHAVGDKARRVRSMFTAIAPRYDLNNHLHSLGRDQVWRRLAVKAAVVQPGDVVLDVACGTGDLAMAFRRAGAGRVLGVDFTFGMLRVAQAKALSASIKGDALAYQAGDAMRLPVADASVDVVSIAFGIRNVDDPVAAVGEFCRVLRPGGRLVILEFGRPTNLVVRGFYNVYFKHVMPRTAAIIARDRSGAYRYLPRSVTTFLDREAMVRVIGSTGFVDTAVRSLTLGVAAIYSARKPS